MAKSVAAERRTPFKAKPASDLYETDFFRWTQEQAALLRAGEASAIDWKNVAEEIDSLGRRDRREIGSRLKVLIAHLLKWQFQPEKRSKSWMQTIGAQRQEITLIIDDSPSLRPSIGSLIEARYSGAVDMAAYQTKRETSAFPRACPYSADEILAADFWPGSSDKSRN